PMTLRKAIVASKAQMQRRRPRMALLDEAPYPALVVIFRQVTGSPLRDPVGALYFTGDDVISQVGRQHAQPVDFLRITLRVGQRYKSPERNATQPERAAPRRAGGQHHLLAQPSENGPISNMLERQLDEDQVQRQCTVA